MAKSFAAQALSWTRSSRKSTRAVEESLLVVLALDTFGLLRGEWRVGRSRLGSKTGVDNGTLRQPVKKALRLDFFGGLLRTCTDGIHFAQGDGNVFNWLRATSSSHIKRQLVYFWLPMLLMLGRFVYSKVKSGLVQKLALAVVLNWADLVTMTSNHMIIRACALRSLSKSLVLRAFAQEEGSQ
jgi:hypothetical protein